MRTDQKLEREVAAICDLSREDLVSLWVKAYGCPPPKGVKRGLLERSAAWHLQAKRLGGLSAHARRVIRQHARRKDARKEPSSRSSDDECSVRVGSSNDRVMPTADGASSPSPSSSASATTSVPAPIIKPPPALGTRLMREWNGRMHIVDITDDGILFDGKLYRSLTAVARHITGTHWSGPRFFGL